MAKENFMDGMYAEDLNEIYKRTGWVAVVEDGHVDCCFNENKHNWKAYEALNDYGKERYRNLIAIEIN